MANNDIWRGSKQERESIISGEMAAHPLWGKVVRCAVCKPGPSELPPIGALPQAVIIMTRVGSIELCAQCAEDLINVLSDALNETLTANDPVEVSDDDALLRNPPPLHLH